MKTIMVRGLDRPLPVLTLGTMNMSPQNSGESNALLDGYYSTGGNALDTAHVYGGGNSEKAVGSWIRSRKIRDKVTVITKGCHPKGDGMPRVNPDAIRADLAESLDRLDTDYIDLYLLHRDDPRVDAASIIGALNREVDAGNIRAFGASNWTTSRIIEANRYATGRGLRGFCLSSIHLSLAEPGEQIWPGCLNMDGEAREFFEGGLMPLLAWSAQARGFFSDKYRDGSGLPGELSRVYGAPGNLARAARARELAARTGSTANRVSLAWVLARRYPVSAVIGPRNNSQLEDSLAVLDEAPLSAETCRWLEDG